MAEPISAFATFATVQFLSATGAVALADVVYVTAYAAGVVAVSSGLNYASSLLAGGGDPNPSGQTVAISAPVTPNRHLVGRGRTYGVMGWMGSFAYKNGDTLNKNWGQMQVISSTTITEVEVVLVADTALTLIGEAVTGSNLFFAADTLPFSRDQDAGNARLYVWFDIGSDPGVRDPMLGWYADQPWQPLIESPNPDDTFLVPFYDEDARGDGLAKLSSVAFQDVESFPQGPPRMSVVAKGIRVFDPRVTGHDSDDPATWEFSENPALIAAWFITREFGFGATYDEIDLGTLIAAADACDEIVDTYRSTGAYDSPPTEPRFRCGGEVIESDNRDGILNGIVASMGGSWCQSGGKWFLYAGVFAAPTEAIDDSWIMRNVEFTAQRSRQGLFNTVNGTFTSESRRWQPAPYPQVQEATAIVEDGGVEIVENIDLAFVNSHTQAQRCMLIEMRRSHLPRAFRFETPIGFALRLVVGKTVSLTQIAAGYGIDDVPFRVASWELAQQDGSGTIWVAISLDEESQAIYDIDLGDLADTEALTASDPEPPPTTGTGTGTLL